MGKANKSESNTSGEKLADDPGVDPGKKTNEAEGAKAAPKAKAKRTRVFRGQECEIEKTFKNTQTGAIYDRVLYKRKVTNRKTGEVTTAIVGRKMRRPGTGVNPIAKEVEIEE